MVPARLANAPFSVHLGCRWDISAPLNGPFGSRKAAYGVDSSRWRLCVVRAPGLPYFFDRNPFSMAKVALGPLFHTL